MTKTQESPTVRRTRNTPPKPTGADGAVVDDHPSTPYERALGKGNFRELLDTDVNILIEQAAVAMAKRGIVDEIGVLRVVLARLMTEEHDLQVLTKQVSQVVSVALAAARTRRLIEGNPLDDAPAAIARIVDELAAARRLADAERSSDDHAN